MMVPNTESDGLGLRMELSWLQWHGRGDCSDKGKSLQNLTCQITC